MCQVIIHQLCMQSFRESLQIPIVLTCFVPFPRSPDKHMASNAYVLVNAALMVFFERAQSPSVAAVASDCLRQVLSSMSSGNPSSIL